MNDVLVPAGSALQVEHTTGLWEAAWTVADGTYRYLLTRRWPAAEGTGHAVFILLNPSTATADIDDPTVRRCVGFARRAGCGGLVLLNLFALRATHPRALTTHPDPIGPHSDWFLDHYTRRCRGPVIAGWGAHGHRGDRARVVTRRLRRSGVALSCLGLTAGGQPRHPLYLPQDAALRPYPEPANAAVRTPISRMKESRS